MRSIFLFFSSRSIFSASMASTALSSDEIVLRSSDISASVPSSASPALAPSPSPPSWSPCSHTCHILFLSAPRTSLLSITLLSSRASDCSRFEFSSFRSPFSWCRSAEPSPVACLPSMDATLSFRREHSSR